MQYLATIALGLVPPTLSYAAFNTFSGLVDEFVSIINVAVTLLISVGILFFFYHAGQGIFANSDSANAKTQLKGTLKWGIIIIFMMVSIWGILQVIGGEFQLIQSGY